MYAYPCLQTLTIPNTLLASELRGVCLFCRLSAKEKAFSMCFECQLSLRVHAIICPANIATGFIW